MELNSKIGNELNEIEMALKAIAKDLTNHSTKEILDYFFRSSGKYLRPTLALFSAKIIKPEITVNEKEQLIKLCVAIELIHSASLVHDDIIDNDAFRRGQKTLNSLYGNKIAVLAGDILYSKAFSILSKLSTGYGEEIITQVTEKMCIAEIEQAKKDEILKDDYLKIIEGKTASFMEACCRLGALSVDGKSSEVEALGLFGLNFGMVYQILDDCMDCETNAARNGITYKTAAIYAEKAKQGLNEFKESIYKQELMNLLDYILNFSHSEIKKA